MAKRVAVIRKPEESSKVPLDQPVQVDLSVETAEAEKDAAALAAAAAEEANRKKQTQEDDPTIDLKKQLADLQKANEAALAQAAENDRRRREAERIAAERQQEVTQAGTRAQQAEEDAISNGIVAAQSEADSAQRDLENAITNQDAKLAADAQRRLARAESRLLQLEDGKAALEARKKEAKERPVQQQQLGDPVENHINSMPGLMASERAWLLAHRDLMTDNRKNARLQAAHFDAEDAGHARGTEAYFKFVEEKLGYRKAEAPVIEENDDEQDTEAARVSAPVSRQSPSPSTGKPASNRITLSPAQREAAKSAGVDEVTYARNLQLMLERKKEGLLQ